MTILHYRGRYEDRDKYLITGEVIWDKQSPALIANVWCGCSIVWQAADYHTVEGERNLIRRLNKWRRRNGLKLLSEEYTEWSLIKKHTTKKGD